MAMYLHRTLLYDIGYDTSLNAILATFPRLCINTLFPHFQRNTMTLWRLHSSGVMAPFHESYGYAVYLRMVPLLCLKHERVEDFINTGCCWNPMSHESYIVLAKQCLKWGLYERAFQQRYCSDKIKKILDTKNILFPWMLSLDDFLTRILFQRSFPRDSGKKNDGLQSRASRKGNWSCIARAMGTTCMRRGVGKNQSTPKKGDLRNWGMNQNQKEMMSVITMVMREVVG